MEPIIWKDRRRYLGLPISFTRYSLSETRLFSEKGLFTTVNEELNLFRVRDIRVTRTLGDKIFGCGTVTLFSSDKSDPKLDLRSIKNPMAVKERLVALVAEERRKHRIRSSELMGNADDIREFDDDDESPER